MPTPHQFQTGAAFLVAAGSISTLLACGSPDLPLGGPHGGVISSEPGPTRETEAGPPADDHDAEVDGGAEASVRPREASWVAPRVVPPIRCAK